MKKSKNLLSIAILLIVLLVVWVSLTFNYLSDTDTLAIYNPADVNPELVDESLRNIEEGHMVADFELINQNGDFKCIS